ncbi:hypothetical protein G6011_06919 [Alternaria panax]|uniref:Uncharacterized protein n=1 Tax=Alternaria panax TaxID=48097 RepID=A0AAD4F919_9PLEO|nr:hypothetical protein G6011_06919 [Alternaria panax]
MKLLDTILVSVTTGLALLTAAAPTVGDADVVIYGSSNDTTKADDPNDWSPTEKHHGYAMVEVWVGRPAINGGELKGGDMNAAIWNIVGHLCPSTRSYCNENWPGRCVQVEEVIRFNPFPVEGRMTKMCMAVHGAWQNEAIRQLLINTVSAVFMGFTDEAYTSKNCWEFPGRMFCNIPNGVRVNLPPIAGGTETHVNWMKVEVGGGGWVNHEFHCCETRDLVDKQLDKLEEGMKNVFHQNYGKFRETNCMVRGWMNCEQCCEKFDCEKCNKCGKTCKKLG